jgi:hypothetical protein
MAELNVPSSVEDDITGEDLGELAALPFPGNGGRDGFRTSAAAREALLARDCGLGGNAVDLEDARSRVGAV